MKESNPHTLAIHFLGFSANLPSFTRLGFLVGQAAEDKSSVTLLILNPNRPAVILLPGHYGTHHHIVGDFDTVTNRAVIIDLALYPLQRYQVNGLPCDFESVAP
jgi:hypothetical protein